MVESNMTQNTTEIATSYIRRGWQIVPIPAREKGPKIKGWQNLRITEAQVPFSQIENVGILLGEPSKLVCVDLDFEPARELASYFLPATGLICGRGQNPRAHWFYAVDVAPKTEKWRIPPTANVETHHTVELLSTGAQVVVGPSIHPSGDVYDVLDGDPATIDPEALRAACLALHRAVLAKLGISEEPAQKAKPVTRSSFSATPSDLRTQLDLHGATILAEGNTSDGCAGYYVSCPREALHTTPNKTKDCMVWTGPGGGWQAKCLHASCGIDNWLEFRTALDPTYQTQAEQLATVDLSAFGKQTAPEEWDDDNLEEDIGYAEIEFPAECLRPPGLIGRIVDYSLATARYPQPEHSLAGALALMSLITGRMVTDDTGTRTNIMIVALGPTRSGKEHPRAINKKLLELCGKDKLYEEKLASHSALHGFLNQSFRGLLMNDEFGDFLATARQTKGANTQPAQIISAMIKLYSSSSGNYKADRYADNTKQVEINQPHLVLYGTSTGEVFWKHVTPEYLSGGLFGRVMIFENRGYVDPQPVKTIGVPEDVYREIDGWFTAFTGDLLAWANNTPIIVPHTPEARERYDAHELAIAKKRKYESPLRAALWSGCAEITGKLALLFSCSRSPNPLQIQTEDVALAIRLSNWLTRRKVELSGDNVAENATESAIKRVFKRIKEAGTTGISKRNLSRQTQWLKGKERAEILMELMQSQQILLEEVATGTNKKTILIASGHARQRLLPLTDALTDQTGFSQGPSKLRFDGFGGAK